MQQEVNRMNRFRRNHKGFTMIELMVVVVIVAVLAAIAIPIYGKYIKNSRLTEATARIGEVITAAKAYAQEHQDNNGVPQWPPANGGGVVGTLPDATGQNFDILALGGAAGGAATGALIITAQGKNQMTGVQVQVTVPNINQQGLAPVITGL
jgi:prepilin-type N-terminal cleavage/methylation domain-containing protein